MDRGLQVLAPCMQLQHQHCSLFWQRRLLKPRRHLASSALQLFPVFAATYMFLSLHVPQLQRQEFPLLQETSAHVTAHLLRHSSVLQRPGKCFRCGEEGHWSRDCPSNPAAQASRYAGPSKLCCMNERVPHGTLTALEPTANTVQLLLCAAQPAYACNVS